MNILMNLGVWVCFGILFMSILFCIMIIIELAVRKESEILGHLKVLWRKREILRRIIWALLTVWGENRKKLLSSLWEEAEKE